MCLQRLEVDRIEHGLVRRFEDDRGDGRLGKPTLAGRLEGLDPPAETETPPIAGREAGEPKLRPWGGEVVALLVAELEELGRHPRTEFVSPAILGMRPTAAVPFEPGNRIGAAGLKLPAEDVAIGHTGT